MTDRLSLYKVLTEDLASPYKGMQYEVGESYHCEDFDDDPEKDCSDGLYAVGPEGLIYAWKRAGGHDGATVVPVKVWGDRVEIDEFKRRYEHMAIAGDPLPDEDVRDLARSADVDYRLEEALYPVHPFDIDPPEEVTGEHVDVLRAWDSVWASVRVSVWYSVGDIAIRRSVWDIVRDSVSVMDSVWHSVGDSVWHSVRASVRAYYGSIFPEIDDWKYIDHEPGEYPFQPAVDLWYEGLVPSHDGDVWRLHGGEGADILWEGEL